MEVDLSTLRGHPTGFERYVSALGVRVLRMHYSADPEKASEDWIRVSRIGITQREWDREFELRRTSTDGPLVFPEIRRWHFSRTPLGKVPGSTYWCGWDCGTSSPNMAAVLFQLLPWPIQQIQVIGELVALSSPTDEFGAFQHSLVRAASMETFAPIVRDWCHAYGVGTPLHYGDETGRNRQGATGAGSFLVARSKGVRIRPVRNEWQTRAQSVVWALEDWASQEGPEEDWIPRFVVDETRCPVISAALRYGYQVAITQGAGEGRMDAVYRTARKNVWSHPMDGLQYGLVRIRHAVRTGVIPYADD